MRWVSWAEPDSAATPCTGLDALALLLRWEVRSGVSVVGAAVGASPKGAGLGLGIGLVVGTAGWLLLPEMKLGDTVSISVIGLAAGGLAGWMVGAGGGDKDSVPIVIPFQVRF